MKVAIAIFLVIFFPFSQANANSTPEMYISEVGAYEKDGYEWIEVTTLSTTTNFFSYKFLENGTDHGLTDFLGNGELIPPMSRVIIAQNAENIIKKYGDSIEYLFDSSWGNLKLSGEEIGLVSPDGNVLDTFVYIGSTSSSVERFFENEEFTLELNTLGNSIGEDYEPTQTYSTTTSDFDSEMTTSTKEVAEQEKNTSTTPTTTSTSTVDGTEQHETNSTSTANIPQKNDLVINEFLYRPGPGESEWIEIKNISTSTFSISNLEVHDGKGKIGVISEEVIRPGEVTLLSLNSHKLNNLGDAIKLFYDGDLINSVSYGEWPEEGIDYSAPEAEIGESIALFEEGYQRTLNNTPGSENILLSKKEQKQEEKVVYKESVIIVKNESTADSTDASVPSANKNSSSPPSETKLEQGAIMITKIYPSPKKGELEYLEIKNMSDSEIDLGKIYIADKSKSKTTFSEKLSPGETKKIFSPKGNLNNGGDTLLIANSSDETVIDQVSYGNTKSGETLKRHTFELNEYLEVESATKKDTPDKTAKKEVNKVNETNVTSTKLDAHQQETGFGVGGGVDPVLDLLISEIFPNPKGTDQEEFIELYNPTEGVIDIGGLLLDDDEGGSKPYKFKEGTKISPREFLLIKKAESKLSLNNTSDSARLLFGDASVIFEVAYDDVEEDKSFVKHDDGVWVWTPMVTPGSKNLFEDKKKLELEGSNAREPQETKIKSGQKYSVEDLKKAEDGIQIEVSGIVAATSGMIGKRYLQLVSDTPGVLSGVQVYLHSNNFPKLGIGDIVSVTGEVSKKENYTRIKLDSEEGIKILVSTDPPDVAEVSLEDVDTQTIGSLIKVNGEITNKTSKRLVIENLGQEIIVKPYNYNNFKMENFLAGQTIVASGVLQKNTSGFVLVPRSMGDLIIKETEPIKESTSTNKIETKKTNQELVQIKVEEKKQQKDKHILEIILLVIIFFLLFKKNSSNED